MVGVLIFIAFGVSFRAIQESEQVGGTPAVLRKSFMWNEKVWRLLRTSRLSVSRPVPPEGKGPRVNGMLGLTSPLEQNYLVEVISGEKNVKLPVAVFRLLPKTEYSTDFRCIEGWSEEMHFAGVKFSEFMKHYNVGKKTDGSYYQYVGLETPDSKYYVSIDMESMLHEQTLLAYEMNQRSLSLEHGSPLRLVIPIKYGIKSLKRVGRIFFSDERPGDYWAERGYDWYSGL